MERRFIITGGGTSGHINPALAIARLLTDHCNAAGDTCRIMFTGRKAGLEGELVPAAGYDFRDVPAQPVPLRPSIKIFPALFAICKGILKCRKLIAGFCPDAVISTGGYVSAPLLYAARHTGVPIIIHESNAFPGRANKQLSKGASLVMTGFPDQEASFPKARRVVYTGNPVRPIMFGNTYESSRAKLNIPDDCKLVFAMGGSLGSATITNFILSCAKDPDFKGVRFVLSVGKHNAVDMTGEDLSDYDISIMNYIDEPNIYMSGSDVCILRAGAVTCAEIAQIGACAVMIPYPYAAYDHQTYNARILSGKGGGVVMSDDDVKAGKLKPVLLELLADKARRLDIRRCAGRLAVPDTGDRIISAIEDVLEQK